MCDRPLPQQQLCTDLAAVLWALPAAAVPRWLRAFWATMAREWTTGIDVLRMEKFLLLVRRMLGVSLVWMQQQQQQGEDKSKGKNKGKGNGNGRGSKKRAASGESKGAAGEEVRYDAQRVEVILTVLADWPFRTDEAGRRREGSEEDDEEEEEEKKEEGQQEEGEDLVPKAVPVGLKLHALDIWVDEAEKAGLLAEGEDDKDKDTLSGREVLRRLNDVVDRLASQTLSKAVRIRSKESLADDRLPWNEKKETEEADGEWGGLDD